MGLLSTEVEVGLSNGRIISYYENLGYTIPRRIDKYGDLRVPQGTKIKVKIQDLYPKSKIPIDIECDDCNKKYSIPYSSYFSLDKSKRYYCKSCAKKQSNMPKKIRYKNKRNIKGYSEFIKSVLERDAYTCYCCGRNSDTNFNVHHLNGFHWYEEGRMDLNNAITLCEICHNNFHVKYGNKNNTKEQFEEWIGTQIYIKEEKLIPIKEGRKVYCIEDNIIYQNAEEAKEKLNLKNSSYVYNVCNHNPLVNKNSNARFQYTINGKHVLWYEDYLKISKNDIDKYIKSTQYHSNKKKVICITTNKIFESIQAGIDYYKCNNHVRDCCNGKRKYCGKLEDGTKLQWMFYEDYLNNTIENLKEAS